MINHTAFKPLSNGGNLMCINGYTYNLDNEDLQTIFKGLCYCWDIPEPKSRLIEDNEKCIRKLLDKVMEDE